MAMVIQTNVASLSSQKNLAANQKALAASFNRLSSGYRVNSAADDAAGLAISEGMKSQIRSFVVAERNANDGISMAQTAEGALNEIHGVLGRMRELAMQSANGGLTQTDRNYINEEYTSLTAEITRIQDSSKFNSHDLVKSASATINFQVGLSADTHDHISVTFGGVNLASALSSVVDGSTASSALASLAKIDGAITKVSEIRSNFGTAINRLEVASSNIQTMRNNLSAANSRIRDVDVAGETANMSKNQVLTQAGVSILAQANQLPQMAFGLIG